MTSKPREWVTGEVVGPGFLARLNTLERIAFWAQLVPVIHRPVALGDALRDLAALESDDG